MNPAGGALKQSIEDVFCDFAYLEVDARSSTHTALIDFPYCARVEFDDEKSGAILLFASSGLVEKLARHFTGCLNPANVEVQLDTLKELANVLAGHVYEVLHASRTPKSLGIPRLMAASETSEIWSRPSDGSRFEIFDEAAWEGVVLLDVAQCWQTEWA